MKHLVDTAAAVLTLPGRLEKVTVVALCVTAALRVFFFSAAFPFFNNVDEPSHVDLVCKYARGHVPAGIEPFDTAAARDILLFGSPEYIIPAERFPGARVPPPVWTLGREAIADELAIRVRERATRLNHESTQTPVYYAVAGVWYRFGKVIGLSGGHALYWIRFINVIVAALLVVLARVFARTLLPDRTFLRLGMPLLIAFFPQDTLYSVNNDVLLPLAGGAAILALFVLIHDHARGYAFHAITGLLVAATILVKPSSAPVGIIALAVAVITILRAGNDARRRAIGGTAILLLAMTLPIGIWVIHNGLILGDVTGTNAKSALLGWTRKPLGELFNHPLFTPKGLITFWHETTTSFWRGEFTWGLQRIASSGWDLFYSSSSLLFPGAAVTAMILRRESVTSGEKTVLRLCLTMVALSLLFLAVLSVVFDFGDCFYPSRAHPFLTSGRLALAALIPFAALYLTGVEVLLPGQRLATLRWGLLSLLVAGMTVSEIMLSRDALYSAYNWFHLLHAGGG